NPFKRTRPFGANSRRAGLLLRHSHGFRYVLRRRMRRSHRSSMHTARSPAPDIRRTSRLGRHFCRGASRSLRFFAIVGVRVATLGASPLSTFRSVCAVTTVYGIVPENLLPPAPGPCNRG